MKVFSKARHAAADLCFPIFGMLFIIGLGFLALGIRPALEVRAGTGSNYAWSENTGWISFDCANENACGLSNYRVSEAVDGSLSGYAWSSAVGWISFNASDVSGCPSGTCAPKTDLSSGALSGWARACGSFDNKNACSGTQSQAGGWDGWIHLGGITGDGHSYGTTQSAGSCNWTGWAWGSTNMGWIHLTGSGYQVAVHDGGSGCAQPPVPTISASPNPTAYEPNNVTQLTWSATGAASCGNITYTDLNNQPLSVSTGGRTSGTTGNVTVPPSQTVFSITCSNSNGSASNQVTVVVPWNHANDCKITTPFSTGHLEAQRGKQAQLSWGSTNCEVCSITGSDGSNYPGLPTSGTQMTNPINQSTLFTLTCNNTHALQPSSDRQQLEVRLINWKEI